MKTVGYGRILFGASAVGFGMIALKWRDADTWQQLYAIQSMPFGRAIGAGLMVAQIVGGIGIWFERTTRLAAAILGMVYVISALTCLGVIVGAPKVFGQYDGFFEQFCLLCGAIAAYAATEAGAAKAAWLGRMVRIGLGLCTISFAVTQVYYFRETAELVPSWIPLGGMFWAVVTTIAFALAVFAILSNRQAQLAIRLMALMMTLFGVLVWIPLIVAHPEAHGNWSEGVLTFLLAGAAWVVGEVNVDAFGYHCTPT